VSHWLYIEDNRADAELVRLMLHEHLPGLRLTVVSDGEHALAFLRKQGPYLAVADPSLILMDLSLPRMGGVELLPQIRQALQRRSTPVIVFSASEDQQAVAKCYEAGATSFVLKPSDLDDLVGTLKHIANFWCNQVTASAAGPGADCYVVQHAVGAGA
jgi:two-component system, chemotaxis family, response regulator Rcp1